MKRLFTILSVIIILFGSAVYAQTSSRVILTDFRNVNLFEAFYVYDQSTNDFNFVSLDKKTYKSLSSENKAIYKKVLKSKNLYEHSNGIIPDGMKINYCQRAYKINNYNLPAARKLVDEFQNDEKLSTALYYALQIKKYDKKNKYSDTNYKIGELYYKMGYYDESISYLEKNISANMPVNKKDSYLMLADSYYLEAKKQATPYKFNKQALTSAENVLKLDGQNEKALEIKYDINYIFKNYRTAMSTAAMLMRVSPDSANYALKYANCRGALNDKKTELIYLQKAAKLIQKNDANQELLKEVNQRIKNLGGK